MAIWPEDGNWYLAKILSVSAQGTYKVLYLQYGNESDVLDSYMRPFEHATPAQLVSGQAVFAQYPDDKMFYEGMVDSAGSFTGAYNVVFKGKGLKPIEVLMYDIYIPAEMQGKLIKKKDADTGPGEWVLPNKCIFKPGDDEKTIQQKRKLAKIEHRKWKESVVEAELATRKNSWQDFQKNGAKKPGVVGSAKTKALTGVKRPSSIFATKDVADPSGTFGLVGTGKGMTQYESTAKHFKSLQAQKAQGTWSLQRNDDDD